MSQHVKDNHLASDLRIVIMRLVKKIRNQGATSGMLSQTERSTIVSLDQHKQLLPSELAAMEKITTQSMSQVLNHLDELGFITRTASETDKRKTIISLSQAGQDILIKVRNDRDEWLNKALAQTCNAAEMEALRQAIALLTKLVDFD
ncbi:MAG: MarR family transcriptional regulator [Flavipsychrobacter sp.]|nr:MarR family transcriptional regulator [Flavipsychrobacter sp.]